MITPIQFYTGLVFAEMYKHALKNSGRVLSVDEVHQLARDAAVYANTVEFAVQEVGLEIDPKNGME